MLKMTPGPWKVRYLHPGEEESDFFIEAPKTNPKAGYNIEIMGSEDGPNYTYEQKHADAEAIVSAVNNTWGIGVHPESVETLKGVVDHVLNMIKLMPELESTFPQLVKKAKEASEKSKL